MLDDGDFVLVARSDFAAGEKLSLRCRGQRRIIKAVNDYVSLEVKGVWALIPSPSGEQISQRRMCTQLKYSHCGYSSALDVGHKSTYSIVGSPLSIVRHVSLSSSVNEVRDFGPSFSRRATAWPTGRALSEG